MSVAFVASLAIATILVGLPPKLPEDARGWTLLLLGSAFALFNAIAIAQFKTVATTVAAAFTKPGTLVKKFVSNGWKVLVGLAVIVLVAGLSTVVGPPPVSPALEPGPITLLAAFSQSPKDPRSILIDEWNQSHPDNQVIVEPVPGGADEQHARVVNDAKPGGTQSADVYALDDIWMSEFITNNYIRTMAVHDQNFIKNVLATCKDPTGQHPGLWGLPFTTDAGLLFYRSDVLGQPGFTNWGDYLGLGAGAASDRAKGNPAFVSGRGATTASLAENDEILTVSAFEAIWAAGGQVSSTDGQPITSPDGNELAFDPNAVRGLQNLAAAYQDRRITLPDADRTDADAAIAQFRSGNTLFMRNWPVAFDKLRDPAQGSSVPFGVAPLPGPSVLGGQNLTIAGHTSKPRAAQAFAEFMTSSASELTLFEIGGAPPTRDDTYDKVLPATRPYAEALRTTVRQARPRPVTPFYTKFSAEFRRGMITAIRDNGQIEPDLPARLAAILTGG